MITVDWDAVNPAESIAEMVTENAPVCVADGVHWNTPLAALNVAPEGRPAAERVKGSEYSSRAVAVNWTAVIAVAGSFAGTLRVGASPAERAIDACDVLVPAPAVIARLIPCATTPPMAWNDAVVCPEGMLKEVGMFKALPLELRLIPNAPTAGPRRVIVQVAVPPAFKSDGAQARPVTALPALMVSEAVAVDPAVTAVTVAVTPWGTERIFTANVALVAPPAIVTLAGTDTA